MGENFSASRLSRPTDAELGILRILWRTGPATVREVQQAREGRAEGYTTVLKLLQSMPQRGLVTRDDSERGHVDTPVGEKEAARARVLGDVLDDGHRGVRGQSLRASVEIAVEQRVAH
ncbi:MAG: BlaI/MecI/CopY family transcriptional regulator, partial [Proteobacteria bacterium]|nr:BlaI/MecI/CopY family transcriptional regulator [Pseudomonadota bacterium]